MSQQMSQALGTIHVPLRVALAGSPNCGKTSLFNSLTGSRQKVGNYPGVTVERKEGQARTLSGRPIIVLDLPGTYSLDATSPDEEIARDVLEGRLKSEAQPEVIVAVADATNLERNLSLVLELRALNRPVVLALNMMDLAKKRGYDLDLQVLARELSIPVVPTIATRAQGLGELLKQIETLADPAACSPGTGANAQKLSSRERYKEVDRILSLSVRKPLLPAVWSDRLDRVLLHPVWGSAILTLVLVFVFHSIFHLAKVPQDLLDGGVQALGHWVTTHLPEGWLQSLLVDGIIAGVGSVIIFLPQILILFTFILLLEDSGYLARAAFLMDRLMGKVGLSGRAFVPLLSSYACAIPGIMAARTIENRKDRLITIMIAPLTTCSARLPVYALLIGAFIPHRSVFLGLELQGLVLLGLYVLGMLAALTTALVLRRTTFSGEKPVFILELPTYKVPSLRGLVLGLIERAKIFLRRAGTVILSLSIALWFLVSFPKTPDGLKGSFAGRIGHVIEPLVRPIGFNWEIGVALIPGFAAREVMVSALATVYSVDAKDEDEAKGKLGELITQKWSLATGLALLVWYVFSFQCISTFAVVRRETNSWKWPWIMMAYMMSLAYVGAGVTYWITQFILKNAMHQG